MRIEMMMQMKWKIWEIMAQKKELFKLKKQKREVDEFIFKAIKGKT